MDEEGLLERTVASREIHRGGYLVIREDRIVDARGREHRRDVVEHPGAVAMLAIHAGDLLLVRQFRTPVGRLCLEVPAGTLDRAADGSTEDPDLAAPRELGEETGYTATRWRKLGRFFTAPGFATEEMHLYLATELEPIPGYAGPDTDERLQLVRVPWRRAVDMAEEGLLDDAKSLVAVFWLDRLVARGEVDLEG